MNATAVQQQYTVIHVDGEIDAYRDAIVGLWKYNLADVPPGRFDWLYSQNPGGPAKTWLALGKGKDDVVGVGSLYPRTMVINGREHTVGVAVDFAIHESHRVLGPALKIQRAIIASSHRHGFQFNYAFPNGNSAAVFRRVGYRPLGEIRTFVKLLTTGKKIAEYCRLGTLALTTGWILDGYFQLRDRGRMMRCAPQGAAVEVLDRCDERFDALWRSARAGYPLIGEKSAAFLNWRYADNTFERYHFWCLVSPADGQLLGFIAYAMRDDVAVIADLFTRDRTCILPLMLLKFADSMRKSGTAYITLSYFGTDALPRQLRALGFLERKTSNKFFIYWDSQCDPEIVRTVSDKTHWFHFGGDLDLA